VMGCVVNGPGESKAANVGISLPGKGEAPVCPVYVDGEIAAQLRGTPEELAETFHKIIEDYVTKTYPTKKSGATPNRRPEQSGGSRSGPGRESW